MTDIDANAIQSLRQRRIELCAELDQVDADIVALGVNPRLGSLIVAILKVASHPLSNWRLYEHTKGLALHSHSCKDFVLHLDRLHAAGQIVPVDTGRWTVPRRRQPKELADATYPE